MMGDSMIEDANRDAYRIEIPGSFKNTVTEFFLKRERRRT